ncbi:MAG: hypothetical protein HRU03_06200 [Nanoarchaeales archaeon]|nr:hypothetical protein [Nanoarchaeales archaeon]
MENDKRILIGKMIRYLANVLLGISLFVFIMNLTLNGVDTYTDNLLWTQLNSMWLVVIMLMMIETHYLPKFSNKFLESTSISKSKK